MSVSPMLALMTCLAGGLGAMLRFLTDAAITARAKEDIPWGTFSVNVSGAFLAGAVMSGASAGLITSGAAIVLGGGLLGGYTTFSTASVQAAQLLSARRATAAVGFTGGMLVSALLAAWAGLHTGAVVAELLR